jgi:predicted ester cyclase
MPILRLKKWTLALAGFLREVIVHKAALGEALPAWVTWFIASFSGFCCSKSGKREKCGRAGRDLAPIFERFKFEGEDQGENHEECKQIMVMVLSTFPDYHQTIHDWIAEQDKVVTRWTIQGTHKGVYAGISPTGKQVKATGINIFHLAHGKMVEHLLELDRLSITQQLGLVPLSG